MRELEEFVKLSKYAGERYDLIQAGGGNSSVKLNNRIMLIKASGFMLSEVELDKGYLKINIKKVTSILNNKKLLALGNKDKRNKLASKLLGETVIGSKNRPSIETFLHALLYKYTLHIHPLSVSAIICKKKWKEILKALFDTFAASKPHPSGCGNVTPLSINPEINPSLQTGENRRVDYNISFVNYRTPGVEFAIELKKVINKFQKKYNVKPKIIFMQNHGLIVSSDNCEEVRDKIENVLIKLENYLKVDLNKYRMTNKISALLNNVRNTHYISYLSSDAFLNKLIKTKRDLFFNKPFCPDVLVYCGMHPLEINNLKDPTPFIKYYKRYSQLPSVIIYNNYIFFAARDLKKAKEIEEVFKYSILVLSLAENNINFLNNSELLYLNNWEPEKYRQRA